MNKSSLDKYCEANLIETHPDFKRLKRALKSIDDPKLKERYDIVMLFTQVLSISQVSATLNIDRKTVRKWIARFIELGLAGLNDKPRSGRKTTLLKEDHQLIEKTIESGKPDDALGEQWHVKALANYLNLPYHPVLRFLKTKGIEIEDFPYHKRKNSSERLHATNEKKKKKKKSAPKKERMR